VTSALHLRQTWQLPNSGSRVEVLPPIADGFDKKGICHNNEDPIVWGLLAFTFQADTAGGHVEGGKNGVCPDLLDERFLAREPVRTPSSVTGCLGRKSGSNSGLNWFLTA
jgi:hypothetical protein